LVNSNFDEVTAGNAMKYSSVVDNNGKMDFGTVKSFVTAAKDAGTTIYGHTLAWHAQQNKKYLNSLI
jgi:GH35 family endo-1,4-beta-xylanase